MHVSVDALGNPLRFTLTGGQAHDITQADELIDGIESDYVIADRGYDSQRLRERIVEMGATPVIPVRFTYDTTGMTGPPTLLNKEPRRQDALRGLDLRLSY